jgi:hypothetical protein
MVVYPSIKISFHKTNESLQLSLSYSVKFLKFSETKVGSMI